jgi:hypothetical protein
MTSVIETFNYMADLIENRYNRNCQLHDLYNRNSQLYDLCNRKFPLYDLCNRNCQLYDLCNRNCQLHDLYYRNCQWYDLCNRDFQLHDLCNRNCQLYDFHVNATFNNISIISWWSVLLVEETGGPGENHWPVTNHWQTLSHIIVHLTTSVVIDTDCIGSCKSNYHTITTTTALLVIKRISKQVHLFLNYSYIVVIKVCKQCTDVQYDFHTRSYLCRLAITWRVSHVKQEMLTLPDHLRSLPFLSMVRVARS